MEAAANTLLRKLGAGVRPGGVASSKRAGGAPIETAGFAALVGLAQQGEIESGRLLAYGPGVEHRFDSENLARLSSVADAAQAAGLDVVIALVSEPDPDAEAGEQLVVERAATLGVRDRTISAVETQPEARLLTGADAFVRVPSVPPAELRSLLAEEAGRARRERPGAAFLGTMPVGNASLSRVLAHETRTIDAQDPTQAPTREP